jgi:outer membrane cobalamin receptor
MLLRVPMAPTSRACLIIASVLAGLLPGVALGQSAQQDEDPPETLVVTGSYEPVTLSEAAGSVDVISGEELDAWRYDGVLEALRHRAGVHADQPGARGSRASVYTRGLDPNHTLVLIDGVALNDPTNARGGSYDFSTLSSGDIERIEIVRGPISAVHGSDALGGAIQVITRDGQGPDRADAEAAGGRYGYVRGLMRAAGQRGPIDLSLSGSYENEGTPDGIGNYRGGTLNASLGANLPREGRARATLRFQDSRNQAYPDASGGQDLAVLRSFETRNIRDLSGGLDIQQPLGDDLELSLLATAFHHRENRRSPGVAPPPGNPFGGVPAEPNTRDNYYEYGLTGYGTYEFGAGVSVTAGGAVEWERGESDGAPLVGLGVAPDFDEQRVTGGPLAELQWRCDCGLTLLGGSRVDFREGGSAVWTPRVNASYRVPRLGTEIRGGFGRGWKQPSFFALGNPIVGNDDLRAEKSIGWEAGFGQQLAGERFEIDFTYFDVEVEDLVDLDTAIFQLINLGKVRSRGVELSLRASVHETLQLRGHATYTDTEDQSGRRLRNRPKWRGGVAVEWTPIEGLSARVDALFVGEVKDFSIPTGDRDLHDYARVDLALAWAPRSQQWLELFLAVDNLLDENYEEAIGFPAVGIRPRAGVAVRY